MSPGGLIAALHFWFPKMSGKMYNEKAAIIGWVRVFVGFNLTFLPQFVLGMNGMPRRYFDYSNFLKTEIFARYHGFSTIGAMILGVGFVIILFYLIWSLFKGPKAPANPWGGLSLEWETPSPPPTHNFIEDPVMTHGPYDYDKVTPKTDDAETSA